MWYYSTVNHLYVKSGFIIKSKIASIFEIFRIHNKRPNKKCLIYNVPILIFMKQTHFFCLFLTFIKTYITENCISSTISSSSEIMIWNCFRHWQKRDDMIRHPVFSLSCWCPHDKQLVCRKFKLFWFNTSMLYCFSKSGPLHGYMELTFLSTTRDCNLDAYSTAKQTIHFCKRLTADRKKTKWPYSYSPVILAGVSEQT